VVGWRLGQTLVGGPNQLGIIVVVAFDGADLLPVLLAAPFPFVLRTCLGFLVHSFLPFALDEDHPNASLPEAWLVAMSRRSLVVLGLAQPSLCTKVLEVVPERNERPCRHRQCRGAHCIASRSAACTHVEFPSASIGSP
jgi:hypothetical protein